MDDCAEVNRHNTVMFFNSQIYKIQVFKFLKISIIQLIKKSVLLEKFKKAKNILHYAVKRYTSVAVRNGGR